MQRLDTFLAASEGNYSPPEHQPIIPEHRKPPKFSALQQPANMQKIISHPPGNNGWLIQVVPLQSGEQGQDSSHACHGQGTMSPASSSRLSVAELALMPACDSAAFGSRPSSFNNPIQPLIDSRFRLLIEMPLGKNSRPGKRPAPSSSYLSTITTVGFVALCVFGVWMLTSSSVVPPRGDGGSDSLSSGSRLGNSAERFEQADLTEEQDHMMSALGRRSGSSGKTYDEDGESAGKAEEKQEPAEEEEKSQASGGEEEKLQGAAGEGAAAGEGNEQGQERTDGGESQQQSEENVESQQRQQAEANEENQQQQQSERNEENQQQSLQQQSEGNEDSQQTQSTVTEDEIDQTRERPQSDSHTSEQISQQGQAQEQQEQEEQQQQQQQEPEREQQQLQQQAESGEEQQKDNQQSEESGGGDGSNEQQSDGVGNNEGHQQSAAEAEEQEHQNSEQQQAAGEERNVENTQQEQEQEQQPHPKPQEGQAQEQSAESNAVENQEQTQQIDNGNAAGSNTQHSNEPLTEPHVGDSIPKEPKSQQHHGSAWSTQAGKSETENERQESLASHAGASAVYGYTWELCNVTAGPDYIPCLDNEKAIRQLHSTKHYEHRERHCPVESPSCLVPLPQGYKLPIEWPKSRDNIWYSNVPHTKLAEVKGHQNWVKVAGDHLTFPGGGTQFIHGALHYIDFIQQAVPKIAWGKQTRVVLDVGCGVASFGGYLFERDVLAMSFAPKDEHEAQVQFALERGIPAISAVMGSKRLSFPSRVFDIVHCARCRVPWHVEGGTLLLELNRVLRPGGYFVWSATPVYQKLEEDVEIWKAMKSRTASMCWELVTIKKDRLNSVGAAIYRKPISNECYNNRKRNNPPMCKEDDDPNAAWYVPLQTCMHRIPVDAAERGSRWPKAWPLRLQKPPYWLNNTQVGVYGKPAPADFVSDYEHWKRVVSKSYLSGLGISWSNVRNVMDMRAVYGGCKLIPVMAEIDRIVRPGGKIIVRDKAKVVGEVENMLKSMHWEVRLTFSKDRVGILSAQKTTWRPEAYSDSAR
ncbi:hypothetical protein ACLOJK_020939 [Asimina triloba]